MKFTNKHKVSLSLAVWLGEDNYDYDPDSISATALIKPIKQIILGSRIKAEAEFDIVENVPTSMGSSLHDGIEKSWLNDSGFRKTLLRLGYPENIVKRILVNPTKIQLETASKSFKPIPVYLEQRVKKTVNGYTLSGKYDFVGDGTLEDFKSTGVFAYMSGTNDEKYSLQGSIYRWLNPDIITSDYMLIQFIFTDWSKLRSIIEKNKGYPSHRVLAHKVPLMSYEETDKYIKNRLDTITRLQDAPEDQIPECTDKDLWRGDTVYKYFKNPEGKRATKNFDNPAEAHNRFIKDGSVGIVKEVKGQVKACLYCKAFPVCKQKNIYLLDGTLVVPEG